MKIFSCPKEVEWKPDYANYDPEKEIKRGEEHMEALKRHLVKGGYRGPRTGEILQSPVADGNALYMYADAPRGSGLSSCLIHLPYVDAYHNPDVAFLPKKEVLRRLDAQKELNALFRKEDP